MFKARKKSSVDESDRLSKIEAQLQQIQHQLGLLVSNGGVTAAGGSSSSSFTTGTTTASSSLSSSSYTPASPSSSAAQSQAAAPHGLAAAGTRSLSGKTLDLQTIQKLNLPGGVMISLNVRSQRASADVLKNVLTKWGVDVWVCTDIDGGSNFRDEIVQAVKSCRVVICLINEAWAMSGECKDEFSLARRRHLTSHESGRTVPPAARLPGIIPVSFPDLVWDRHPHVELLAANTNFLVCREEVVRADMSLVEQLLRTLLTYHVPDESVAAAATSDATAAAAAGSSSATTTTAPAATTTAAATSPTATDDQSKGAILERVRTFQPNVTSLRPRYLGTIAYTQSEGPIKLQFHETMEVFVTAVKDRAKDSFCQDVDATVEYTVLRLDIVIGARAVTFDELRSVSADMASFAKEIIDEMGKVYGQETMKGTFEKATGVLSLQNVSIQGTAAPTWRHLTLCGDGDILVGIGGGYSGRKQEMKDLTATRLVAY